MKELIEHFPDFKVRLRVLSLKDNLVSLPVYFDPANHNAIASKFAECFPEMVFALPIEFL